MKGEECLEVGWKITLGQVGLKVGLDEVVWKVMMDQEGQNTDETVRKEARGLVGWMMTSGRQVVRFDVEQLC